MMLKKKFDQLVARLGGNRRRWPARKRPPAHYDDDGSDSEEETTDPRRLMVLTKPLPVFEPAYAPGSRPAAYRLLHPPLDANIQVARTTSAEPVTTRSRKSNSGRLTEEVLAEITTNALIVARSIKASLDKMPSTDYCQEPRPRYREDRHRIRNFATWPPPNCPERHLYDYYGDADNDDDSVFDKANRGAFRHSYGHFGRHACETASDSTVDSPKLEAEEETCLATDQDFEEDDEEVRS